MRGSDWSLRIIEAFGVHRIQLDLDIFVNRDPNHIFTLLWPVLDHVLFHVGKIISWNRECESEIGLMEQYVFGQLKRKAATGS